MVANHVYRVSESRRRLPISRDISLREFWVVRNKTLTLLNNSKALQYNKPMETITANKQTMLCQICGISCKLRGKHRNGLQRFKCVQCGKSYTEEQDKLLGNMTVPEAKALMAIQLLIEGTSIRTTERLTGLHRDTICRLLVLAGEKCERLLSEKIQHIDVRDVEVDEIWTFVGKKEGNKPEPEWKNEMIGDAYTFVGMERQTKLVLAWHLGRRTAASTMLFMRKLRIAVNSQHWFQLTTDGFPPYPSAVAYQFGNHINFATLVKVYRSPREGEQRYSPGEVSECIPTPLIGNPDPDRICTSHIERQNLTMRMQMRRVTRLTNAFSKKWENLNAALALHFAYYNFCRVHKSLRVTPAMEASVSDHVWTIAELLA
jgi:transposase-like protein/IS1 family transposase